MKIISDLPELTFDDVLLLPGYSKFLISDEVKNTDVSTHISRHLTLDIPLCSAPMPHVTETQMAIALGKLGGIGFIHCFQDNDSQLNQVREVKKHHVKVAVSVYDFSPKGLAHIGHLLKAGADLICIETAQAFNYQTIEFLKKVKSTYPKAEVCVALVVTPEATEALVKAGADSIRVGIGGGSHCTTRLVTGIGRPQLSAVQACAAVAHKHHVPIISDTGITYPGDLAKAIAFGADAIMIGGLFSGTAETPGQVIYKNRKPYKFSAGMCSPQGPDKYASLIAHVTQSSKKIVKSILRLAQKDRFISNYSLPFQFVHEGVSALIPYKGSVTPLIDEMVGGLRRSMWYLGAPTLQDIQKNAQVVITTANSHRDNIPRV